jgi:hypothetical protein
VAVFTSRKKVKIQSNTGLPIQMFEVQVYSSKDENVALGKVVLQSATLNDNARFAPKNAIDGNNATFSHTKEVVNVFPWWEVDLGDSYDIESVKILNRWCTNASDPSRCLCRLSHATISLFDEEGKWVATTMIGEMCDELEWMHEYPRSSTYCVDN